MRGRVNVLPKNIDEIESSLRLRYEKYSDPFGLDLNYGLNALKILYPLYKHYFRVRVHGLENVSDKPYVVISNHTGQIAIDALLVGMAFVVEKFPPRILRAMHERFLNGLPFAGDFVLKCGSVLGDRQNCHYLLEKGESILVCPEGVKGIAKPTSEFYQLRPFTQGFFRVAAQTQTEILPVAVVGAEEFYPLVYHSKKLAKFLGLPALPITPTFPWLGPLGLLPMPSPVDIYIGTPYSIPEELNAESPDKEVLNHVHNLEGIISGMVKEGLKNRRRPLLSFGSKQ